MGHRPRREPATSGPRHQPVAPRRFANCPNWGWARRCPGSPRLPTATSYYEADGTLLFREPRGIEGGYRWPQYSVHRGQLQMLLLDAVRERVGVTSVRTGVQATGFSHAEREVITHTTHGDIRSAFLVGADGIHSVLRRQLHPGADPLMWSGVMLIRGATRGEPFLDGETMAVVKGPEGVELVAYPIGGGLINWILKLPRGSAGPLPGDVDWNEPANRGDALDSVARWDLPWLDVWGLISRTETMLAYPMVDRTPLTHVGRRQSDPARRCRTSDVSRRLQRRFPVDRRRADARRSAGQSRRERPAGLRRQPASRNRRSRGGQPGNVRSRKLLRKVWRLLPAVTVCSLGPIRAEQESN